MCTNLCWSLRYVCRLESGNVGLEPGSNQAFQTYVCSSVIIIVNQALYTVPTKCPKLFVDFAVFILNLSTKISPQSSQITTATSQFAKILFAKDN